MNFQKTKHPLACSQWFEVAKGSNKEKWVKGCLLYTSMVNGRFYMQLGVDLEKAISDGIQVAIDLYGDR